MMRGTDHLLAKPDFRYRPNGHPVNAAGRVHPSPTRTYTPVEIFLAAGVLYLILTWVSAEAWCRLERRAHRHMADAR